MADSPLEFGWFLPTAGDTRAYGVPEAAVDVTPEYLGKVAKTAEESGFDYILIPVDRACWEAYITGAFITANTNSSGCRVYYIIIDVFRQNGTEHHLK